MELLRHTDVFLPNAMEATRMARTSDLEGAAREPRGPGAVGGRQERG